MPLSEDEQRILQEMEQTLREHDREFVARVDHSSHRLDAAKNARWSMLGAIVGFVLILCTFRVSLALATVGFLVMLLCTLVFAHHLRQAPSSPSTAPRRLRPRGIGDDWSEVRRRMRSRFGHHD